jgi:hypothetical protein
MSIDSTKRRSSARLIGRSDTDNHSISHVVERPFRDDVESFQREGRFIQRLLSYAGLPTPDKLPAIVEFAARTGITEVGKRAQLSLLEEEFVALMSVVVCSPQRKWQGLLRNFLEDNGWLADLRGGRKRRPVELSDYRRGAIIHKIALNLKAGFDLKARETKLKNYSGDDSVIKERLRAKYEYSDIEVEAIISKRTLSSAACYCYIKEHHESRLGWKTILNSYERYNKSVLKKSPK